MNDTFVMPIKLPILHKPASGFPTLFHWYSYPLPSNHCFHCFSFEIYSGTVCGNVMIVHTSFSRPPALPGEFWITVLNSPRKKKSLFLLYANVICRSIWEEMTPLQGWGFSLRDVTQLTFTQLSFTTFRRVSAARTAGLEGISSTPGEAACVSHVLS